MSNIEKMKNELNIHKPLRTYFDAGSHQFNQTNFDEKINTLSRIISTGFDLEKIIKEYKRNYSGDGYKHVYGNVKATLIGFISYIKTGKSIDGEIYLSLDSKSEKEVIQILISDIREMGLPLERKP